MYHPAQGKPYTEPNISVNGQRLSAVGKFIYLGSTLYLTVTIDDEVNDRLLKQALPLADSEKNVWARIGISTETKIKVYKAVVLTTLLYGSESWTVYKRHAKKLNHFHTICLRKLNCLALSGRTRSQTQWCSSEQISQAPIPS